MNIKDKQWYKLQTVIDALTSNESDKNHTFYMSQIKLVKNFKIVRNYAIYTSPIS